MDDNPFVYTYPGFGKVARLRREVKVTEKIDGTNGLIELADLGHIDEAPFELGYHEPTGSANVMDRDTGQVYHIRAGSRNRWLKKTKQDDNYGFAAWVHENAETLVKLGPGNHYGEWFGRGIQRGYGLSQKYFALFNEKKFGEFILAGHQLETLTAVPTLAEDVFSDALIDGALADLAGYGSVIAWVLGGTLNAPAEGVIVQHSQNLVRFKVLLEHDDIPKAQVQQLKNIKVSNTGKAVAFGGGTANSGVILRAA